MAKVITLSVCGRHFLMIRPQRALLQARCAFDRRASWRLLICTVDSKHSGEGQRLLAVGWRWPCCDGDTAFDAGYFPSSTCGASNLDPTPLSAVGLGACWGYGGILSLGQWDFFGLGFGYCMHVPQLESSAPSHFDSKPRPGHSGISWDWNQITRTCD